MKKNKRKYTDEQIGEFERAALAESCGGADITRTMLLQMMEAQKLGDWGDTPYDPDTETEQKMLERICQDLPVTPAEFKAFLDRDEVNND